MNVIIEMTASTNKTIAISDDGPGDHHYKMFGA